METFFSIDEYYKLFEEHNIVRDEYKYKIDLIKQNKTTFHAQIESFLSENPQLKKLVGEDLTDFSLNVDEITTQDTTQHLEKTQNFTTGGLIVIPNLPGEYQIDNSSNKDDEIKKLYREIVKLTHPDKYHGGEKLDIYLLAGDYYQSKDYVSLIVLSHSLGLVERVDIETIQEVLKKIAEYKFKNHLLEKDITLIWYSSQNKTGIIIEYISQMIKYKKGNNFIIF